MNILRSLLYKYWILLVGILIILFSAHVVHYKISSLWNTLNILPMFSILIMICLFLFRYVRYMAPSKERIRALIYMWIIIFIPSFKETGVDYFANPDVTGWSELFNIHSDKFRCFALLLLYLISSFGWVVEHESLRQMLIAYKEEKEKQKDAFKK